METAQKRSYRKCRPNERLWQDHCVDRNLEDTWLEQLNSLSAFKLISICEGHVSDEWAQAHINLRVKSQLQPIIWNLWQELQPELHRFVHSFHLGHTSVDAGLRYTIRNSKTYANTANFDIRIISVAKKRENGQMDDITRSWFEHNIDKIKWFDAVIYQKAEQITEREKLTLFDVAQKMKDSN